MALPTESLEKRRRLGLPVDIPPPDRETTEQINAWTVVLAIWSARWWLVIGTVAAALAAAAVTAALPRSYSALATLLVTPPKFATELKPAPLSVETYAQLAESAYVRDVVLQQAREKNIIGPEEGLGSLRARLYPSREPQRPYLSLIGLTVESGSPQLAQSIANLWATVFVEQQLRLATANSAGSADFILREFPRAAADLKQAEQELNNLRDVHARSEAQLQASVQVDLLAAQMELRQDLVVQIERQISMTQLDIVSSREHLAQLEVELARTPRTNIIRRGIPEGALWNLITREDADQSKARVVDTLPAQKVESEETNLVYVEVSRRLSEERVRFNRLVPEEKDLQQQLVKARQAAEAARRTWIDADMQVSKLERQHRVDEIAGERVVAETRARFTKLEERIGDAQLAKAEREPDVKIGSMAGLPQFPSRPNATLNIAVAMFLGFCVSMFGAWAYGHVRADAAPQAQPR